MSQEAVERVLGRLLTDEQFRSFAERSIEKACRQHGYVLSDAELAILSGMNLDMLKRAADSVDPHLQRAPGYVRSEAN